MLKNVDVLKYVMCILVVMIHVGWSNDFPIVRMAVPVFFIISSYLFFSRLPEDENEAKKKLKKFVKRACLLYMFWFILWLPLTVVFRHWYALDFYGILSHVVVGVLFKSTFPAAWYISAYVIGIVLIYFIRKHDAAAVIIGIMSFLLCCLTSNYYGLLNYLPFGGALKHISEKYQIYNSFPAGLLFIYMGMRIKRFKAVNISALTIIAAFSIVLLYLENNLVTTYSLQRANDTYLSLALLAPSIVLIALKLPVANITDEVATGLRRMSTIYYCSYFSILLILMHVAKGMDKGVYFVVVLILCTLLSAVIFYFQKKKPLRWLKFSY